MLSFFKRVNSFIRLSNAVFLCYLFEKRSVIRFRWMLSVALVAFVFTSAFSNNNYYGVRNMQTGTVASLNPCPVVTLLPYSSICLNGSSSITLSGGTPLGGIYSGIGVSNGIFDPSVAGAGIHEITYTYTDTTGNGCSGSAIQQIVVYPLQVSVQAVSYCAPGEAIASIGDSSVYGVQWFRDNQLIQERPIGYAFNAEPMLTGMSHPYDMYVDAQGNRFVVELHAHRVVRYAAGQSAFTIVAGGNGNGSALNQLNNPTGLTVDAAGNVYVADHSNHRVVRWAPGATQGVVVAGSDLGVSGSGNNQLNHPYHVRFDGQGRLYVSDRDNHRVMRYSATVSTTTTALAGTVIVGAAGNGSANNQLSGPHALYMDVEANRMYLSDDNNARIMRYDLTASNVANSGTRVAGGNGHGAQLNQFSHHISGILLLGTDLYLADLHGQRIMRWKVGAPSGEVIAGGTGYGPELFRVSRPTALRIDAQGNLEYLERDHARLVRFAAQQINSDTLAFTEAGTYRAEFKRFGLNCTSVSSNLTINKPIAQISSSAGATVCEGDTTSLSTPNLPGYVYQWYKDGQSIAGATANTYTTSISGSYTVETGDSSGCFNTSAPFMMHELPQVNLSANGLCLGSELTTNIPDSNVVQIDWYRNNQLVKQTNRKYKEEGEPVLGNFNGWINNLPFHWGMGDFHIHTDGSIYVSDMHGRRVVRYFPSTGQFTVVAGGNGSGSGLNQLGDNPRGVFVTNNGDVYVADPSNHRVVKWAPNATQGVLVAGLTSTAGSQLSRLNLPWDVVVDDNGNVYISDDGNHRIVRWAPGATQGVVVAGSTGQAGSSLNQLNGPKGIFVDKQGQLFVADYANHRVLRYNQGSTSGTVVAGGSGAGASLNQIHEAWDVYVDESNSVYVADYHNHRVIRWAENAREGEVVAGGAGGGNGLNQTTHPYAISKFTDGGIYVVSSNWLKRFDLDDMPSDTLNAEYAGNYSVRMRTLQGCENNSQSHTIFAPEVSLSSTRGFDVCEGDTTILSTIQDSTYTYQWFRDGVQIAGATVSSFTAFEPGLYLVEVLDSNACSRISESMRIWPKPDVTLTANGLCLGSELTTNIPDSNVVQIDWFRNNQRIKQISRKYKEEGEPVLGNFNGWINNLPMHWGMGDFHIHIDGSIYFSDPHDRRVVRYFPSTGQFTIVAGGNGEGNALNQLHNPQGIFVASNGDVFIADMNNHRVVRWSPGAIQGVVVAGATSTAGTALNRLNHPSDVFIDQAGNLFIADNHNHRVVRWAPRATTGVLVAGTTGQHGGGTSNLTHPTSIYVAADGRLYVADNHNHRIMRFNAGSTVGTVVAGGNGAGSGLNQLTHPHDIYVDGNQNIYISDNHNHRVMRWRPSASVGELVVGGLGSGGGLNQVPHPGAMKLGNGRDLYVTMNGPRLTRFDLDEMPADTLIAEVDGIYRFKMQTLQGCSNLSTTHTIFAPVVNLISTKGFDVCEGDSTILSTTLDSTYTYQWFKDGLLIAGATASNLTAFEPGIYHVTVTDSNACSKTSESMRIWPKPVATLTANGLCLGSELTTNAPDSNVVQIDWFMNNQLVKQTNRKYKEEGEPVLGNFNGWINNLPFHWGMGDFHIHTDGSIYISDMHDRRVIRYFPSTGQFTIVAGGNGEGNALNQLNNPQGIFVTANGDLFIADMNNHRVVRWSPGATQGVVVAGATSTAGTALNRLNHPSDVFIDAAGNLFIADNHNHRVVRWAPGATTGVLVAGTTGQSGGGITNLTHPTSIYVAADGRLYVADNHNHRVMRFNAGSTVGTVVAGGNWAGSGLNQLTHPNDIYVDGSNNVYVADAQNHRIVLWRPSASVGELVVGGFGSGSGLNQVPNPNAIKLGNGRDLYVSMGGPRLTRFNLAEMPSDTLPITTSGSYTARFTTILGCENTSNTIDVPRLFGSDTVRVFGNDTLLAGLNGGAYQQYLWSTGSTDSALQVSSTGMYQLTATDTTNGCSREQQIFVYLGRASVVASETAVCEGTQVQLSIQATNLIQNLGMGQVRWSTGDSTLSINRTFNQTSTIGFEYVDGGFVLRDSITIAVRVRPSGINIPDTISVCGDSVVLDPGQFDGYLWSTGDTTRTLIVYHSGQYWVSVDSNDCSTTRSFYVSLIQAKISSTDSTICQGEAVELSALNQSNYGLEFNGVNQYVDPGYLPSFSNNFTIEFRAKASGLGTNYLIWPVWGGSTRNGSLDAGVGVILNASRISIQEHADGYIPEMLVYQGDFTDFEHFVLVYENKTPKLFVNGQLVGIGAQSLRRAVYPTIGVGSNNLGQIGGIGGGQYGYFSGQVDYVRVWSGVLDTNEVQNLYRGSVQIQPQAAFEFNEGIGDSTNATGDINSRFNVNGATWVNLDEFRSGQTYLWSTGDTLPTINVIPQQTTTFHLIVSDGITTCTDSFIVDVRVRPSGINLPDTISVCGDSLVLDPGQFDGYLWSTGDTTRTLIVYHSGQYWVSVDSNDCSSQRSVYVSLVKADIVAEADTICQGTSVQLAAASNQVYVNGLFNGSRYVRMPNPGPVGDSARTIMFWVKPSANTPMPFLSYGNMATGTSLLTLGMNVAVNNCSGQDIGPSILSNSHFATFRRPVEMGEWNHIAYVVGGSNASFEASKVYLNGVLISQGVYGTDFCGHNWGGWTYNTTVTPMDLGYGEHHGRAGAYFTGDMDEVAIWNRSLSASDIRSAMESGPRNIESGLIHYYPFDALEGDSLLRDVIGGNHGILRGGAYSSQVAANYIGQNQNYLWSTGDTIPVITVSPQQTTTYYLTVTDGITTCTDSMQVFVNPVPVINLSSADSLTFCLGGSALLVADSVAGATYRWVQEDVVVNGLKVEVFSTHSGNGSTNEYAPYPNNRIEFDRFFDTTYESTSLHYQGRHSALQSLSWGGWSSLTNVGIAVPNNGEFFAVQVSGFFVPTETGTYRFTASSDDHSDLIIGDSLVLSSYVSRNGLIHLQAGQRYAFKARMQEFQGHESFSLSWEKPSVLNSGQWQLDTVEVRGSRGAIVLTDTTRYLTANESGTYRAEVTTSTGCTVSSNGLQIEVLPLPSVSLGAFNPVCITDSITVQLSGGLPQGGTYSGPGVNNGVFDPLIAGAGVHEITYSYTDTSGNGCSNSAVQKIVVLPLTVNVQVDDYCAPGEAIASIADSSVYGVQWYRNNQLIQERPIGYAFSAEPILTGMSHPYDMHIDAQGNRFVVEFHANRVVRYAAGQSAFTVVAGGNGNGSALNQLNNPTGLTVDAAGNVYVADHSNHRVVRWAPGATQGVVVAGSALGVSGSSTNQLNHPYHVKFDGQGRLYVSDRDNHRVMRYPATVSTTTTVSAGTVIVGAAGNGSANNQLSGPHALYMDVQANRMYLSDDNNARIMRYDLAASNVANSGMRVAGGNGHGAQLNQFSHHIAGILLLGTELYLADLHGQRIMRWKEGAPSGEVIAGGTGYGPELFRVSRPTALRIDAQGNLEYLERDHARLVRFAAQQINSDTLAFTEAGTYRAEFKRFGMNCTSTSSNFIINKPIAQISSSAGATVCEGDTTFLSTPNLPGYVYQWYKDGQSIAGATANTYTTSISGSYTVETGDSSGCFNTSAPFMIHAEPQVNFTADGLCLGSTLTVSTSDSNVVGFDWFRNGSMVNQVRVGFEEEGEPFVAANTSNIFGLNQPFDLATDHLGNIYYSEHGNHRVVRRAPDGSSPLVVAGNGSAGAGLSSLDRPTGIFVDAALNVYVADMGNHRVVKWAPGATQGVLVAGASGVAGSTLARLNDPMDVVVDDSGAVYVADRNNHRVVKWLPNATSGTLFAGTGTSGASINQLSEPHGLAIWGGAVYIVDHWNGRIIQKDASGTSIVATVSYGGNTANPNEQRLSYVHVDKSGSLYFTEMYNSKVMRFAKGSQIGEVVAGGNAQGNAANQLGWQIHGITTDLSGNLFVADGFWNQRIMKYNRVLTTVDSFIPTTSGTYSLVTHTVQGCSFQHPGLLQILSPEVNLISSAGFDVCEGDTTNLTTNQDATYTYQWFKDGVQIAGAIASNLTAFEPGLYHVTVIDSNACSKTSESMRIWPKPVATLTANGLCLGAELTANIPDSTVVHIDWFKDNQLIKRTNRLYEEEGAVIAGELNGWKDGLAFPWGIPAFHMHNDGWIYFIDAPARSVVKYFPSTGVHQLVAAGGGSPGSGLNQIADNARGLYVTPSNDVYVADFNNHRVIRWAQGATQGTVVAGITSTSGNQLSRLTHPYDVVVDDSGYVYVSDQHNNRVVRWAPGATSGVIVAGTGQPGSAMNQLNQPTGIYLSPQGQLFVVDQGNQRVMRFDLGNPVGVLVAGGNGYGANLNQLANPLGVWASNNGDVFIADRDNQRVTRWTPGMSKGVIVAGGNGNGSGLHQTNNPSGIAISTNGELYVLTETRLMMFGMSEMPADTLIAESVGTYQFKMQTLQGCSNLSTTHTIFAPVVNLISTKGFDVCEGDTAVLTTNQDATYTYQWFRDGIQIAGATSSNLTAFEPGLYHVTVTDSNACSKTSENMRIWPKPDVMLTANGLCLGSELTTNIPDSNVIQIDWFRNNQLVKQVSRKYLSEGEPVVGNFNGWINNLPLYWGMGDFHIHTDGSIYISDMHDRRVVRYFPNTGQFTVVAGGNGSGGALNQLENPQGVFVTANGDVYVADYGNHRVVRWSPGATAGVVVAGATGQAGSALNRLNGPIDVFVDQAGQLFIADEQNHRVMRWALNATSGVLVAGSTGQVGPGLNQLHSPVRVFVSNSGLLYVSDISNNRVMRYAPGSSTGTVVAGGNGAGNGLRQLNTPIGIFVDENEAVFVADLQNNRVVKWNNGATVGQEVSNNDSLSTPNRVNQPRSLAVGPNKELFVVSNSQLLLKFGFDSMSSDVFIPENAGTYFIKMLTKQGCENSSSTRVISSPDVNLQSSGGFDVCEGDTTQLSTLQDVGYTYQWFKDGNQITGATSSTIAAFEPGLYHVEVLDSNSCSRVSESMRVWPKPTINLIADGVCLGTELRTNLPDSNVVQIDWFRNNQVFRSNKAAFKANGSLYYGYINGLWVSDLEFQGSGLGDVHVHHDGSTYILAQTNQFAGFSVLKSTNAANAFHLVAGGNGFGNALDQIGSFSGAAGGLFVAENGDVYVADRSNHRVVKWTPGAAQGVVVAGGNGSGSGLNQLNNPQSVYVNRTGDVFVVDQSNHRVVRWSPGANAGVVVAGGNGLGAGLNQFNNPRFITISTNGEIFVSDQNNHRVMRYATGSSTGVVVAGGNFSGSALNQLNQPNGIAVDKSGNVFVADRFNNRIVRWAPGAVSGEVVAGLNLGNASGLDRTTRPVGLRLSSDYKLFVISVDSVNGMININSPNRLMSFGLDKLLTDSLIAQQGGDYRIRFTNVNGCSNSSDMVPIFDPQLTFPAIPNLCVTDAGLPLNMVSPTGGTFFGVGVDTGYFHPTIAGVGTHKLYYLYTDSNGCSKLDSQTIQVVPEPVVTIDTLGSMDICQGESVTLQSPLVSGQTYQWYRNGVLIPQATQRAFTVSDSVSAQYHVMVTRNVCEKSSDTLVVIVRPKPVVTIANQGDSIICQGDSITFLASGDADVSYQWYRNGQLLIGDTTISLVARQSGSYTCQVIKINGCADTSNALTLSVLDFPTAQITPAGPTTVCEGQLVQLNANQGTGLTHRWFKDGVLIPGATAATYQATTSGDYTVEVRRQQLCETLSQAITVVVNPLPQISIAVAQGSQFCSGDSILITAQSTAQVLRYAWFRNGQLIPSDSTANFYATLPGYYHARVFDSAGCDKVSDSVQVSYFNPPFANESICAISVDTLAGRNVVVWEKTANVRTAEYNVYREGSVTGVYNLIGRVPFDSLSIFIDTTANPLSQSYRYRIASVDSCGFVSAQSSIHRTIHLSSNIGVNNEVNLFWTSYEGVSVPTHRILRSINGGPFLEIASVSGTTFTYTDLTPPQGTKNYLIEISIPGGCNPSGLRLGNVRIASGYSSIQSNKVAVGSGVNVINRNLAASHSLYPNPSTGSFTLIRSERRLEDKVFMIYDARGRLVRTIHFEDQELKYQIDMGQEADGIYTIRSNDSNWSTRFVIAK